jgi:glyoxylase-like metal-dependent hydrolase (beta-lactamase superfamily II)
MAEKYIEKIHFLKGQAGPLYIIADTEAITLIDVGFPSDVKRITGYLKEKLDRDIGQVKLVIVTHSHFDHISGVDYLLKTVQASVAAPVDARQYLTGRKAIPVTSLSSYMGFLIFLLKNGFPQPSLPDVFKMPWAGIPGLRRGIKSAVQVWLEDGKPIPGLPGWEVFFTPGHTPDGICLYHPREKILFSGDTIINDKGTLRLNRLLVWDKTLLLNSFRKLDQLRVDHLFPGWGPPVTGDDVLKDIQLVV